MRSRHAGGPAFRRIDRVFRALSFPAAALVVFAGCSHAVQMSSDEIERSASHDARRAWQIDTRSNGRILAKRFSLTDSTLVVEALATNDLYGDPGRDAPFAIPRDDISNVSSIAMLPVWPFVLAAGAVGALWIAMGHVHTGHTSYAPPSSP